MQNTNNTLSILLPEVYQDVNLHIQDKLFRRYIQTSGMPIYGDICANWGINPVNMVPRSDAPIGDVKRQHIIPNQFIDEDYVQFMMPINGEVKAICPKMKILNLGFFHATNFGGRGLEISTDEHMYWADQVPFALKEGFPDVESFREYIG